MYCYQLTAMGEAMPGLHVAHEVQRGLLAPGKGAILGEAGGAALMEDPTRGGGIGLRNRYCFAIAGGRPHVLVSWMICVVSADDSVRAH